MIHEEGRIEEAPEMGKPCCPHSWLCLSTSGSRRLSGTEGRGAQTVGNKKRAGTGHFALLNQKNNIINILQRFCTFPNSLFHNLRDPEIFFFLNHASKYSKIH
jgi:hypothetical protein